MCFEAVRRFAHCIAILLMQVCLSVIPQRPVLAFLENHNRIAFVQVLS